VPRPDFEASEMATIRDVATRAGVSVATASRVVNRHPGVREPARSRVLTAVAELGYRTNALARGLAKGTLRTVGLVIPDVMNPYFPALARAVEDAAHADGYALILGNSDNAPDREAAYIRLLHDRFVDGIIVASSGAPGALQDLVGDTPIVLLDRRVPGWPVPGVSTDNRAGARLAVEHLVARGHTRIAHLGGPPELTSSADRREGYEAALRAAGIEPRPAWYLAGAFTFEDGYERMLRLIEDDAPCTAVFAGNDLIAIGALQACQDRGWPVPGRMAIVGFDDLLLARLVRPRLTTVLQPAYQAGSLAWRLLAERLADPAAHPADIVLEPRLVVRETT
jgi:LacI family transcriptional regulator